MGDDLRWETMALVANRRGAHPPASIAMSLTTRYRDVALGGNQQPLARSGTE